MSHINKNDRTTWFTVGGITTSATKEAAITAVEVAFSQVEDRTIIEDATRAVGRSLPPTWWLSTATTSTRTPILAGILISATTTTRTPILAGILINPV